MQERRLLWLSLEAFQILWMELCPKKIFIYDGFKSFPWVFWRDYSKLCCGKITLLRNNIPSSWHHALMVLLKGSEIAQNFSHLGFPRPTMDILNMEDWKNPARNIVRLIAAHPEKYFWVSVPKSSPQAHSLQSPHQQTAFRINVVRSPKMYTY